MSEGIERVPLLQHCRFKLDFGSGLPPVTGDRPPPLGSVEVYRTVTQSVASAIPLRTGLRDVDGLVLG